MTLVAARPDLPELVPVRMLNEHVYCPRLFHLEWVGGQFVDNDYTVDGRWQHRAVDAERGAAPGPEFQDQWREATSVSLSSERLGLIGKADVIHGTGASVVPVDVKRGRPAPTADRIWPPERMQIIALAHLLRDNGYACDQAAIFFVETRTKITINIGPETEAVLLEAVDSLRQTARSLDPPPPLEDSPKCDGCSLSGICLPDETRLLRRERLEPPRRLMAADRPSRPMYVTLAGARLGKKGARIEVRHQDEVVESTRLLDVDHLCVFGNVQVSTQLVRELMSRDAPICWFTGAGWFSGVTEGLPGKHVELRRRQYELGNSTRAAGVAAAMIEGKIRNSRTLLRRNGKPRDDDVLRSLQRLAAKAGRCTEPERLLGFEGTAARLFFGRFNTMLRPGEGECGEAFRFEDRNRRPPSDPINALLSFCYSLLVKDCVAALRLIGFDPYFGVLHRPRFGRPALALDLAEEFRPLIAESVVLTLVNNGELSATDFVTRAGATALLPKSRRRVIGAYERRLEQQVTHPVFDYAVSYRRAIELQGRLLAAVVLGELDRYQPLMTR